MYGVYLDYFIFLSGFFCEMETKRGTQTFINHIYMKDEYPVLNNQTLSYAFLRSSITVGVLFSWLSIVISSAFYS